MADAESLKSEFVAAAAAATDLDQLEELRVGALGRNGTITQEMKGLGALPPEERRAAGQALNALKGEVEAAIEARKAELSSLALDARLAG